MSSTTIESDYTPKDFLQKLLGNKFKDQKPSQQVSQNSHINGNSQSQTYVFNHNQINPKSTLIKRIHFQSVQNLRSPRKNLTEIPVTDNKNVLGFKQNHSKDLINKQHSPLKLQKSQNPESRVLIQTCKSELTQKMENTNIESRDSLNLSIQKAMLLLKVTLNGKISNQDIQSILSKIQKGVKDSSAFDKIIHESQQCNTKIAQNQNLSINKTQSAIKKFKSKSFQKVKIKQNISFVRNQSQKKIVLVPKSKKQRKNEVSKVKKQILGTVKKMKQLFFLNQKSLKMAKRTSNF